MALNMIELEFGKHWLWRTNKKGNKLRPRIKGKVRRWLKENCDDRYSILIGGSNPVIVFETDIDAVGFKLRWL
jgi:hypothetical protein